MAVIQTRTVTAIKRVKCERNTDKNSNRRETGGEIYVHQKSYREVEKER